MFANSFSLISEWLITSSQSWLQHNDITIIGVVFSVVEGPWRPGLDVFESKPNDDELVPLNWFVPICTGHWWYISHIFIFAMIINKWVTVTYTKLLFDRKNPYSLSVSCENHHQGQQVYTSSRDEICPNLLMTSHSRDCTCVRGL